ncbi:MAG: helix-turn-helix transcriptional regulator [Lachnospiraceae bacterium]|nr:helix-turn-helix transcriptional regulator [Lachnospiraceae bacterium]
MPSIATILTFVFAALGIALLVLIVKALLKHLKSKEVRAAKSLTRKSLGEVLYAHRTACKMTQEFVAETIGVSRQAVSKWENGTSDPSTANLIALAKLYGINADELIKEVSEQ